MVLKQSEISMYLTNHALVTLTEFVHDVHCCSELNKE